MKIFIGLLLAAAVFILARYLISGDSFGLLTPSFEEQLRIEAENMNRDLPIVVDFATTLDRVVAGPGNSLTYYYTITNSLVEEGFKAKPDSLESKLRESACSESSLFKKNGTVLNYHYQGAGREVIAAIQIDTATCA